MDLKLENLGYTYSWETVDGTKYEGVVIDIDNECIYVKLDDGTIKVTEHYENLKG